jgi:hypothetical protein
VKHIQRAALAITVMLLAACAADLPTPADSPGLAGTAWHLVEFVGGDDTTRIPDDPARYTLTAATGELLTSRTGRRLCSQQNSWASVSPH